MASKRSRSSGPSAPKGRLAAFSAQVEAAANGQMPVTKAPALAAALSKREGMRCSQLWSKFAQQVDGGTEQKRPAFRVLLPSEDLPPLP